MTRKLVGMVAALLVMAPIDALKAEPLWITAYYAGWRQSYLRPENIDYTAFSHLIHFSVVPKPDGSLEQSSNLLTPENIAVAVRTAHAAGKKILFTVGGQSSRAQFEGAMDDAHRSVFINNLVRFMRSNDYDGIDIDMEDMTPADAKNYIRFVRELRSRLNEFAPRPLLTAAVLWEPAVFAQLSDAFDQINIMSYDLSGPYTGWVTWHSGALYDGGNRFPNGSARLPSTDGLVDAFLSAGVPKKKLGIGVSFNGYVWSGGVNKPLQEWSIPPAMKDFPYYQLADSFHIQEYDYSNPAYHWDQKAQAAYLSIHTASSADDQFVSYENEVTVQKKIAYIRDKGLGGMIVWELGDGYRRNMPPGKQDVLMQAVKNAWLGARN